MRISGRIAGIIVPEVIPMSYRNDAFEPEGLDALLESNSDAHQYFSALPEYVRQMIEQRGPRIRTEDELYRYAENLIQGDK